MAKSLALVLAAAVSLAAAAAPQSPDTINALRRALGGDAAIHAVARVRIVGKINQAIGTGSLEVHAALPDRFLQEIITKVSVPSRPPHQSPVAGEMYDAYGGRRSDAYDPIDDATRASQSTVGFVGSDPLPGSYRSEWKTKYPELVTRQLDAGRREFRRIFIPLLAGDRAARLTASGVKSLTFVDDDGREWQLSLDEQDRPQTLRWTAQPRTAEMSSPTYISTFSDYRLIKGGVIWPHRIVTTANGEPYQDLTIKRYEINGKVSNLYFKK
jgi:hypothetical protein